MSATAWIRNLVSGHRIRLEAEPMTIGRDPHNHIVIPSDRASRHHATLLYEEQDYWIVDHESTNGTFLNGQRVTRERLKHGDHLEMGSAPYIFQREGEDEVIDTGLRTLMEMSEGTEKPTASLEAGLLEPLTGSFAAFSGFMKELGGTLDSKAFLSQSCDLLLKYLEADRVIWYEVGDGGVLEPRISKRRQDHNSSGNFRISNVIEAVRISSTAHLDTSQASTAGTELACPLIRRDSVVGVFHIIRGAEAAHLTLDDVRLAAEMTTQITNELASIELTTQLTNAIDFSEAVLNSMVSGVIVVGVGGIIHRINPVAADFVNRSPDNIVGQPIGNIPGLSRIERHLAECIVDGKHKSHIETVIETDSHVHIPVEINSTPIVDPHGSLLGALGVLKDLREVKRLNEEVRRGQQLSALGQMSAGIAHEIRNPLNSIRGFVELLRENLGGDDPQREFTDIVINEVDRINGLVQDLLDLARDTTFNVETQSLVEALDKIVELATMDVHRHQVKSTYTNNIDPGALVTINSNKLAQVIVNLVRNACEACDMVNEPQIFITATAGDPTDNAPHGTIDIVVSDNGSGIPEDVVERIFEPFFSTKDSGTGLGLAICRKIIEAMNGSLECTAATNQGTTFTVCLPRT